MDADALRSALIAGMRSAERFPPEVALLEDDGDARAIMAWPVTDGDTVVPHYGITPDPDPDFTLLERQNGDPIAHLTGEIETRDDAVELYLVNVWVHPDHRGDGHARKLVEALSDLIDHVIDTAVAEDPDAWEMISDGVGGDGNDGGDRIMAILETRISACISRHEFKDAPDPS